MRAQWSVLALVLIAPAATRLPAQTLAIHRAGDVLQVRAPSLTFIKGKALDRLEAGGSVRFELALAVLAKPDGPVVVETRESFNVSYDLWEERFAVVRIGTPPSSISHLTASDAEQWCLTRLTVATAPLERGGPQAAFWIRLGYRVQNGTGAPGANAGDRFSLRGLIDALSRRRGGDEEAGAQMHGGPFHLTD